MADKPWIYEHQLQSPRDSRPRTEVLRFATQGEAEARRAECVRYRGCSGECRRALAAGAGRVRRG